MIEFGNGIRTIVMAIILSLVFSSCIREDMMCEGGPIVVQRVGEGGNALTRGLLSLRPMN